MLKWVGEKVKQPDDITDADALLVFQAAMGKALQRFQAHVGKVQPYTGPYMWWESIARAYTTLSAQSIR